MVNSCPFLCMSVAFKFSVTCCESLTSEIALTVLLSECWQVAVKDFSAAATFLFADVVIVRPACHEHAEEEKSQVTIATVVKGVWLVPVRESTSILMGQWSLVAHLHVSVSTNDKTQHL